jgi:predicted amidohydrolase
MREWAAGHGVFLAGSVLGRVEGAVLNTAVVYGPDGDFRLTYRKIHLFPPMGEDDLLQAGDELPTGAVRWATVGLAVCYDLRFPELFRGYACKGVDLVIIPTHWPEERIEHWSLLLRARAVENQCFMVGCNGCGEAEGTRFGGRSAMIGPWGQQLAEAGTGEEILSAKLDPLAVCEVREMFPVLEHRQIGLEAPGGEK